MIKIRIGNDFSTIWALKRLGEPEDLSNATDMELIVKSVEINKAIDFEVVDTDKLRIAFTSKILTHTGKYNLRFSYYLPEGGETLKHTLDIDPFEIVAQSEEADVVDEFTITSEVG